MKYREFVLVITIIIINQFAVIGQNAKLDIDDYIEELILQPAESGFILIDKEKVFLYNELRTFYNTRFYLPAWRDSTIVNNGIHFIDSSFLDGLLPEDYHSSKLHVLYNTIDWKDYKNQNKERAELDILLSHGFLLYLSHLYSGKVSPEKIDPEWHLPGKKSDIIPYLQSLTSHKSFSKIYDEIITKSSSYHHLKEKLKSLRKISKNKNYSSIAQGPKIEVGNIDNRISAIKKRLFEMDSLIYSISDTSNTYDSSLFEAVCAFQKTNGLAIDGIIGNGTISALNNFPASYINKIIVNLERHRWLPHDFGNDYIIVNIADFKMEMYRSDTVDFVMDVVVGKPFRSTPAFTAEMTYLVFNPTWTLPPRILNEDVLPELQESTAYLDKKKMKVYDRKGNPVDPESVDWSSVSSDNFPYIIRQGSGSFNSLGVVKFMFPNKYYIYIHDTPQKSLFQRSSRAFSSGCIRLSNALKFAAYLLKNDSDENAEKYSEEYIDDIIKEGKTKNVTLGKKIPVFIVYLTSWADKTGKVNYRNDVYKRDASLLTAIQKRP